MSSSVKNVISEDGTSTNGLSRAELAPPPIGRRSKDYSYNVNKEQQLLMLTKTSTPATDASPAHDSKCNTERGFLDFLYLWVSVTGSFLSLIFKYFSPF